MSRRQRIAPAVSPALTPIVRLWILRLLILLGLHRAFIMKHDFMNDALAEALGLQEWIQPGPKEFNPAVVRGKLRVRYRNMEEHARDFAVPDRLYENIKRLQSLAVGDCIKPVCRKVRG